MGPDAFASGLICQYQPEKGKPKSGSLNAGGSIRIVGRNGGAGDKSGEVNV